MGFEIDMLKNDGCFEIAPCECLDRLFAGCRDDTLIIPRYDDEDVEHLVCRDYYEMHWSEEDCSRIKEAFQPLQEALEAIATDGYDEAKVLEAVRGADSDPDHFVTVYARRVCRLIGWKAPEVIINHEACCLIVSLAVNKYAAGHRREVL